MPFIDPAQMPTNEPLPGGPGAVAGVPPNASHSVGVLEAGRAIIANQLVRTELR